MSPDDALMATSAGRMGYYFASFLMTGILPALFIFHGRSNKKQGPLAIGLLILAVALMGAFGAKNWNWGHLAGLLLVGLSFMAPPRPDPPDE